MAAWFAFEFVARLRLPFAFWLSFALLICIPYSASGFVTLAFDDDALAFAFPLPDFVLDALGRR